MKDLVGLVNKYGITAPLYSCEALKRFGVERPAINVLRFPWLTEDECNALIRYGEVRGYKENPQEEEDVQIPEVVLGDDYWNTWEARYKKELLPVIASAYGIIPTDIQSIQLAKYTPERRLKGNWHTDRSSDVTVTVNLGEPDGTMKVIQEGIVVEIPPAKKGEATIFLGKTTPHVGGEVENEKIILVYWVEI